MWEKKSVKKIKRNMLVFMQKKVRLRLIFFLHAYDFTRV
jgi:hypothetical protein